MEKRETVYADDIAFHRYPLSGNNSSRDYYKGSVNGKTTRLHVYLYSKYVGEIPEGYHIHHKDGNTLNNSLDNLECVHRSEHIKKHLYENGNTLKDKHIRKCDECGSEYESIRSKYCSDKCRAKKNMRKSNMKEDRMYRNNRYINTWKEKYMGNLEDAIMSLPSDFPVHEIVPLLRMIKS